MKKLRRISRMKNTKRVEQVYSYQYLNENFWFDHVYENGYPTKVMAKADFLGMLNELKLKLANDNQL